jgi:hypothetical protein
LLLIKKKIIIQLIDKKKSDKNDTNAKEGKLDLMICSWKLLAEAN